MTAADPLDDYRRPCVLCAGPIQPHRKPNGEIYWREGHNAEPLATGRCCDTCNDTVITARLVDRFPLRIR